MNNIAFEFKDGTIKWYDKNATIRGLKLNGERPIRMYVDDNVATNETLNGIAAINPQTGSKDMAKRMSISMYEETGKYLDHNGTLERVWKNRITNELVIKRSDELMVTYSPVLDGETISEEQAIALYPEEFI